MRVFEQCGEFGENALYTALRFIAVVCLCLGKKFIGDRQMLSAKFVGDLVSLTVLFFG